MNTAELWVRYEQISNQAPSKQRVAATETLIHAADAAGEEQLAFKARVSYLSCVGRSQVNQPQETLAILLHALSWADAHPGQVEGWDTYTMLWAVKGRIEDLVLQPNIALDQVEGLVADYRRRLQQAGYSLNAEHLVRLRMAIGLADWPEAQQQLRLLRRSPRDTMSDCPGCEITQVMLVSLAAGDDERVVSDADAYLRGPVTCPVQPAGVLSVMLEPLTRLGRGAEAAAAYQKIFRVCGKNPYRIDPMAKVIGWMGAVGNVGRSLQLAGQWVDLGSPKHQPSPGERLELLTEQAYVLQLAVAAGKQDQPFALGSTSKGSAVEATAAQDGAAQDGAAQDGAAQDGAAQDGAAKEAVDAAGAESTVGQAAKLVLAEAQEIAQAFDQRNGTDAISRKLTQRLETPPLADGLRLTAR